MGALFIRDFMNNIINVLPLCYRNAYMKKTSQQPTQVKVSTSSKMSVLPSSQPSQPDITSAHLVSTTSITSQANDESEVNKATFELNQESTEVEKNVNDSMKQSASELISETNIDDDDSGDEVIIEEG